MKSGWLSPYLALVAAPLPAIGLGISVMTGSGVGSGIWIQNLGAALVGLVLATAAAKVRLDRWQRQAAHRWVIPISVICVLGTLIASDVAGVHRWLPIGPLRIHAAAMLMPVMLVAFDRLPVRSSVIIAILTSGILFLQPDLAQAAAFATGWSVLVLMSAGRRGLPWVAGVAGLAALVATRSDPLAPVAYVEEILGLAFDQGTNSGVLSLVALALVPAAFLAHPHRRVSLAIAGYLAVTIVAGSIGNFPVPFLGYGMSPILGYFLGIAGLRLLGEQGRAPA